MRRRVPRGLAHHIRDLTKLVREDLRTDGDLLAAFVDTRDEAAFTALVVRHGQTVWAVCRRVLVDDSDAEDAFQATFIALARYAGSLRREPLTGWLTRVAQTVAWKVKRSAQRRADAHDRLREQVSPPPTEGAQSGDDFLPLLRTELSLLPERLRATLTLYYLEGKTQAEVGRILGITDRAVAARLEKGLNALRQALARRGMLVTTAALVSVLGANWPVSAVPTRLLEITLGAGLAAADGGPVATAVDQLAVGVWQSTKWKRWLIFAIVICVTGGAIGGLIAFEPRASARREVVDPLAPAAPDAALTRVDRFGDALPLGAVARIGSLRFRVDRATLPGDAAFFPDGKTLVSVHGGTEAVFWEVATGRTIRTLNGPPLAQWVDVSPDGRRMIVAGRSELWAWSTDPANPVLLWKWKPATPSIRPIITAISPDGKTVAVGDMGAGCIRLLDAAVGRETAQVASHALRLAFGPTGKVLAIAVDRDERVGGKKNRETFANRIVLWDVAAGEAVTTVDAPDGDRVADFVLAPDASTLVWGDQKGTARTVEVATGRERLAWSAGRGSRHIGLLYAPGGQELIEIGSPWAICYRDIATGKPSRPPVEAVGLWLDFSGVRSGGRRISPDGKSLATVLYNQIVIWDLATGRPVSPCTQVLGWLRSAAFTPDGQSVVTFASRSSEVHVWDAATGEPKSALSAWGPEEKPIGFASGAGGQTITFQAVTGSDEKGMVLSRWNTANAQLIGRTTLPSHLKPFTLNGLLAFAVAPTGVVAVGGDNSIVIFDATGQEVRRVTARATVNRLAMSSDGQILLTVVQVRQPPFETAVDLLTVETGQERVGLLSGPNWELRRCDPALSSDGRWVAAATQDGGITLVEVASGLHGQVLKNKSQPNSLAFSRDGRLLAAGGTDGSVTVWDLATGRECRRFIGHTRSVPGDVYYDVVNPAPVPAVAFTPKGDRVVSGCFDGTALVWDTAGLASALTDQKEIVELCALLVGSDTAVAHRASFALAARVSEAVPALISRLSSAVPATPSEDVERWIAELGDYQSDEIRSQVKAILKKGGQAIVPSVKEVLKTTSSTETRIRLQQLTRILDNQVTTQRCVEVRIVATLERAGTLEARQALEKLARRPADDPVGSEARLALKRLVTGP